MKSPTSPPATAPSGPPKGRLPSGLTFSLIILGPGGAAGYGIYQGLNFGLPLTFLKFSRDAEREADFLGIQYMWAVGYDPTSFMSFFEKLREKERKSPGSIAKVFSSHPPTKERVARAQEEIAELLPAREEYVVTTSQFERVKQRLGQVVASRKIEERDSNRPTLRKRDRGSDERQEEEKNEPPVLKRRP